jgi:uncharacterized protein
MLTGPDQARKSQNFMVPEGCRCRKLTDMEVPEMPHGEAAEPVEVPWRALSPEALRGVVEAFVLREGTDYGAREFSHDEKVQQLIDGLARGEARIMFDPVTESVTLLPRD